MEYKPKVFLEKSWKITPQLIFLVVLGVVVLGILITLGLIFGWFCKISPQPPETPPQALTVSLPTSELLKPGEIGEVPGASDLPPVIFNTSGKITEIQEDRLMVAGSGSNFADKEPRNLTVIFTSSTITFEPGQKIKYQGLDGLKYLKPGMKILIEGEENVRGKTEFLARTINLL